MKKLVISLSCAAGLAACASPSTTTQSAPSPTPAVARVAVVDAASVAGCRYLASITESQYSGMLFAGSGLKAAQDKVLTSAGRAGATHVVWGALNAGGAIQTATGSAYRCGA